MANKRGARVNLTQREMIVRHPQLISHKFSLDFTKVLSDRLWDELVIQLNSVGTGATKDRFKWKRCFTDWKSDVKGKASEATLSLKKTGGGEKTQDVELTPLESIEGNTVVTEDGFGHESGTQSQLLESSVSIIPTETLENSVEMSSGYIGNVLLELIEGTSQFFNKSIEENDILQEQDIPDERKLVETLGHFECASKMFKEIEKGKNPMYEDLVSNLDKSSSALQEIAQAMKERNCVENRKITAMETLNATLITLVNLLFYVNIVMILLSSHAYMYPNSIASSYD